MSLRGIWLFMFADKDAQSVLFSRRFPTVERRAVLHQKGTSLTEIPSDVDLCYAVSNELGSRHRLGVAPDEVCSYLLCQYNHFSQYGLV